MPHLFTDRLGGTSSGGYQSLNLAFKVGDVASDVAANRKTLGDVQFMNQVHGNAVVVISEILSPDPTCDAIVTTNPQVTLAVMVADCIPLLLISQEAVAAVHVGRAGLINGVAGKTVTVMRDLGATKIHAILGPAICGQCYEVPSDLQQAVVSAHPTALATTHKGTPSLDLPAALMSDLETLGLTFAASTICTMETPRYFSHRRDNPTGRFAGVVKL